MTGALGGGNMFPTFRGGRPKKKKKPTRHQSIESLLPEKAGPTTMKNASL